MLNKELNNDYKLVSLSNIYDNSSGSTYIAVVPLTAMVLEPH